MTLRNSVEVHVTEVARLIQGLPRGDYAVTPGKDKNHRTIHGMGTTFITILNRMGK